MAAFRRRGREPATYPALVDPDIKELLRDLRNHGTEAEFFAMDDACPPCRALAGKVFDPRDAPVIPVRDCRNDACRCDYLPAL
jgi:hypothetical protein